MNKGGKNQQGRKERSKQGHRKGRNSWLIKICCKEKKRSGHRSLATPISYSFFGAVSPVLLPKCLSIQIDVSNDSHAVTPSIHPCIALPSHLLAHSPLACLLACSSIRTRTGRNSDTEERQSHKQRKEYSSQQEGTYSRGFSQKALCFVLKLP